MRTILLFLFLSLPLCHGQQAEPVHVKKAALTPLQETELKRVRSAAAKQLSGALETKKIRGELSSLYMRSVLQKLQEQLDSEVAFKGPASLEPDTLTPRELQEVQATDGILAKLGRLEQGVYNHAIIGPRPPSVTPAYWALHRFMRLTDIKVIPNARAPMHRDLVFHLAHNGTDVDAQKFAGWFHGSWSPETGAFTKGNPPLLSSVPVSAEEKLEQMRKYINRVAIFTREMKNGDVFYLGVSGFAGHAGMKAADFEPLQRHLPNVQFQDLKYGQLLLVVAVKGQRMQGREKPVLVYNVPDAPRMEDMEIQLKKEAWRPLR